MRNWTDVTCWAQSNVDGSLKLYKLFADTLTNSENNETILAFAIKYTDADDRYYALIVDSYGQREVIRISEGLYIGSQAYYHQEIRKPDDITLRMHYSIDVPYTYLDLFCQAIQTDKYMDTRRLYIYSCQEEDISQNMTMSFEELFT